MAAYDYSALTADGSTRRGVIEADSDRHARRQLREQALTPLQVNEARRRVDERGASGLRRDRLSGEQLALLTRLLGTLLGSGLPLDDALSALARQSESRATERIVLGVRAKILEGRSLADGMAQYPQVFPEVYRATVGAGEQTQHLPLVLTRLAEHVEANERIRRTTRLALVYPAVLTVTAILVVTGLLTFVVPEVVKVFDSLDRELPPLTRGLIAVSEFLRDHGLVFVGAIAALYLGAHLALRNAAVRFRWDALRMRLPIIGRLMVDSDVARFTRMLGIMLGSSVDLIDALHIASKSIRLRPLAEAVEQVTVNVREGESLQKALGRAENIPRIVPHLVASGESSGNLVEMLDTAAEALEHRVHSTQSLLLSLLEPALILVMGGIVLIIVIAILLPIFEMNQLV